MICYKKHFTLLEVLIAIALLSLCIVPLIAPHFAIYRQQRNLSQELDLDRYANNLFSELLKQLYTSSIPFSQIESGEKIAIPTPSLPPGVNGVYFFKTLRHKPAKIGDYNHFLFLLTLEMTPKGGKSVQYEHKIECIRDLRGEAL